MHQPTNTPSAGTALRAALLRSAAAGALALAAAAPARAGPDACVGVGTALVTCTGNQSDGVALGPPGEVFNINSLTTDIAPNTNIPGIFIFRIGGPITLNSDTGPFIINASGGAGFGISVRNFFLPGLTIINQSGTIISEGVGLDSESLHATSVINVTATGNITANNFAIDIHAGNNVSVISSGDLTSAASFGIQARSIFNAVTVNSTSTINAAGAGISAEAQLGITISSAGDIIGGNGIQATSNGGPVTIFMDGSIAATATGIVVTSQLDASVVVQGTVEADMSGIEVLSLGGNINAYVAPTGVVTGGPNGTAGIVMSGAGDNLLQNFGGISSQAGPAILATIGNDEVRNSGILTGNIELDIGTNALNNLTPGLFLSGSSVNVGAGNSVTNMGVLSPGGPGTIRTTAITGNLTQAATGSLALDINTASGTSDRLNVSGDSILSGSVVPNLLDSALLYKQFLIVSTAGTLTLNDLTIVDSGRFDYSLIAIGNELFLNIRLASISSLVDAPLTPNQTATVQYLDRLLASSPSPAMTAYLEGISELPNEAAIIAALDRISPEHHLAAVGASLLSSQHFFDGLMSCPTASAAGIVERDGQCYWARIEGRTTDWERTGANLGAREDAWGVAGGVQAFLALDWLLGGAISYEKSTSDTGGGDSAEGDRAQGGLVLKRQMGATTLAGAIFGGFGWADVSRPFVQPISAAENEQDMSFAGTGLRLSHTIDQDGWYLRPMLDATATHVSYGGFHETGAGVANLIVESEAEWVANLGAALEVGSMVALEPGLSARPYLRVGISQASRTDFSLTARFEGAPEGVAPFTVTAASDDVLAGIAAGLDIFDASGLSFSLSYDGKFGDYTEAHAGSAKLRMAF